MSDIQTSFQGEMQLAGWSETHNGGCKVTFWLPDAAELEAFRALTVRKGNTAGHRFMAALVEIGEDELPVQQEPQQEKPKGGALAKLAGMWANEPEFWEWMKSIDHYAEDAGDAAAFMRAQCVVQSRAELDSVPEAKTRFDMFIRGPYAKWRAQRGLK